MPVARFMGWYTPELLQLNPDTIFVFGDNTKRVGRGGQAIIRGAPNALGIVTKRIGDMARGSFFEENSESDRKAVEADLAALELLLKDGKKVVIPVSRQTMTISLGLERAQLPHRAPTLYKLICDTIDRFEVEYGSWDIGKPAA
jgi:hypothetical protein